jgi:RNA polymerase sigma factor (sigma-70 family)
MKSSPLRHPARMAGASLLRLQSDERLAELAIDGHAAAFDAIVDRYRPAIQRYCAGIVGPSRAEDAAQQTLINAHDALKRTDEVRHLRSWLYRIAHNVSLNVLRAVRDDVPLEDVTSRDAVGRLDSEPVEAFERSERFRATVAALQELPERQRAALVLRELEGRSHEEIADALGVTKGSARQHLMRARVAMRGAVTAITPYPLIVRLSDALGGQNAAAGWTEAAAGVGTTATLAKLTAGVMATGALVGGGVATQHVITRDEGAAKPRAAEVSGSARPAVAGAAAPAAAPAAATVPAGDRAGRTSGSRSGSGSSKRRSGTGHGRGASSASGRSGDDGTGSPSSPAAAAPQTTSGGASGGGGRGQGQSKGASAGKKAKSVSGRGKTGSSGSSKGSSGTAKGKDKSSGSGSGGTSQQGSSGTSPGKSPGTSGNGKSSAPGSSGSTGSSGGSGGAGGGNATKPAANAPAGAGTTSAGTVAPAAASPDAATTTTDTVAGP